MNLPASGYKRSKPKAVIFDIGRVIVRLDPERAFAPIAASMQQRTGRPKERLSAEETWEFIRGDSRWLDWQEGRISPEEWHRRITERLKLSLSFDEFRDAWNRVLDPELILDESLFVQLSRNCKLALLSNTDPIHVECLERRFAFGGYFPVKIYSCSIGLSKPSPLIYKRALERLGVEAGEALYIDDIPEFADAARGVGLEAIRFESPELLMEELRVLGLV